MSFIDDDAIGRNGEEVLPVAFTLDVIEADDDEGMLVEESDAWRKWCRRIRFRGIDVRFQSFCTALSWTGAFVAINFLFSLFIYWRFDIT